MRKNIVSLSIAFIFLVMALTGLLLYLKQKAHSIEMSHTIFGLLFVTLASFHIYNNWKTLRNYGTQKPARSLSREVIAIVAAGLLVLTLALTNVLEPVAEFGKRFAKPRKPASGITFAEKTTRQGVKGQSLTLILQKEESAMGAQLSVTLLDTAGGEIASLYTPEPGPAANLILNTTVETTAPFMLKITATDKGRETSMLGRVQRMVPGISQPFSTMHSPLKRMILEVK